MGRDVQQRLAAGARLLLLVRHERRKLAGGARQLHQVAAAGRLARGPELSDRANASHTYVGGGDFDDHVENTPHPGQLGVDFALDAASGRYRFAKIYPGDNTRTQYRSPLAEPGLNVKAGDYLLAVNGQQLHAPTDPYSLFQLTEPGQAVDLTIADSPTGTPRQILVKPITSELSVRETAWITEHRDMVTKLSGGRIGYIYLSDMEQLGLEQFVRQFYSQLGKQALIIDDRWNGGGFVAPMVLERLRRVLVALGTNREAAANTEPQEIISGPKITLLNHWSASDGDIFPYLFKQYGLGKLVGTRSWGGVRGIRGEWLMMDGGYVTIPEDALYTTKSEWAVENHGVDPDVIVENDPAELLAGHDTQLEKAVSMLMAQIGQTKPATVLPAPPPLLPPYQPSGMVKPDATSPQTVTPQPQP
jgi:tricorn protease